MMREPKNKIISLGEYTITIDYDGNGTLDVVVLDELGYEIEAIYVSNASDGPSEETIDVVDPNLN